MKQHLLILAFASACTLTTMGMGMDRHKAPAKNVTEENIKLGRYYFKSLPTRFNSKPTRFNQAVFYYKLAVTIAEIEKKPSLLAFAHLSIGVCYLRGDQSLPKDLDQAKKHFEVAAKQNHSVGAKAHALYHLGVMLMKVDRVKAEENFSWVARQNKDSASQRKAIRKLNIIRNMKCDQAAADLSGKRKDHPGDEDGNGPGAAKRARKEGDADVSGREIL